MLPMRSTQNKTLCWCVFALAFAALPGEFACSSECACYEYPDCGNDCALNHGDRLYVAVYCESVEPELLVTDSDGHAWHGSTHFCESLEALGYSCTSHFGAYDEYLTLQVTIPGGDTVSKQIPMADNSLCAIDLSYVEVFCNETDVQISDVQYISPCGRDEKVRQYRSLSALDCVTR